MTDLEKLSRLRIALVYDRVNTQYGGAEYVLEVMHQLFPDVPLYTSVYDPTTATWAKGWDVRPSFLQRLPFAKHHHRSFVSLMPLAFETFDFSEFDLVISISSAEAKGIITSSQTLHLNYLLTPTRYLWSHHLDYQQGMLKGIRSFIFSHLRQWDFHAGQRPDEFIAISHLVKQRCEKYYRRTVSDVIYPPFRPLQLASATQQRADYFLMVSRLVDYKRVDLAIKAAVRAKKELRIVGDGPERQKLENLITELNASELVSIHADQSQVQLTQHYQNAQALLLLAEEDFGLVALEAQSVGTPVIVNARSGAAEVVTDGQTGIHLGEVSVDEVVQAMYSSETRSWKHDFIQQHAQAYNTKQFKAEFASAVYKAWQNYSA